MNACEMCGTMMLNEDIVTHMGHWICSAKCGRHVPDDPASEHSSSYDGGGDSLSDSDSPAAVYAESSLDPDEICALCGGYYPGVVVPCGVCGEALCDTCAVDCVPCDAGVCSGCIKGDTCRTCTSVFESRSYQEFKQHSNQSFAVKSPQQFQSFLDKLSKHKGIDPDLDDRDEDGLERSPPLAPLPKVAPPGQRVIDDYVRPALLLSPPS